MEIPRQSVVTFWVNFGYLKWIIQTPTNNDLYWAEQIDMIIQLCWPLIGFFLVKFSLGQRKYMYTILFSFHHLELNGKSCLAKKNEKVVAFKTCNQFEIRMMRRGEKSKTDPWLQKHIKNWLLCCYRPWRAPPCSQPWLGFKRFF